MKDEKRYAGILSIAFTMALFIALGAGLLWYFGRASFGTDAAMLKEAAARPALAVDTSGKSAPGDATATKNPTSGLQSGTSLASIYDQGRPLGEQLPSLRSYARAGNPYAICILAIALDTCMQGALQAYEIRLEDLASEASIEAGNENEVARLSAEIEKRKATEAMCRDVNDLDTLERDEWMQLSAKNGHARSMALYARNPVANGNIRLDHIERLSEYRKSVQSMLNRAANAGIPEAIMGEYMAYLNGEIETPVGGVKVGKDPAKALGAAMAALEFTSDSKKSDLQKNIDGLLSALDEAGRARAASMRKRYVDAYRSRSSGQNPDSAAATETPDSVCSRG
jgi:hypothetical protein